MFFYVMGKVPARRADGDQAFVWKLFREKTRCRGLIRIGRHQIGLVIEV